VLKTFIQSLTDKTNGLALVCFFILLGGITELAASDDFGTRTDATLTFFDNKRFNIGLYGLVWTRDDASEVAGYLISERNRWTVHTNYAFGLNYTYTPVMSPEGTPIPRHRFEQEFYYLRKLSDRFSLRIRNRIEEIWIRDVPKTQYTYRFYPRVTWKAQGWGPIKGLYTGAELFIGLREGVMQIARFYPIGVRFGLAKKFDMDLYYTIDAFLPLQGWRARQYFGTYFSYKF